MTKFKIWIAIGFSFVLMFQLVPAHAQATRTWVSGVGDDANPCSRTAPCKTFAGAISKTAARGEISVLDPGGYGAVTITKSISIINDYSGEAGILASSTTGITVNAAATDIIILRGLVIDGGTSAAPGLNGIRFIAGASLHVEKCLIKNFTAASPSGFGINFAPAAAAELYVSNTTLINNGNIAGATGAAIVVQPTGSGSAKASISNTRVENSYRGILADSTSSTGGVKMNVFNSVIAGSSGFGIGAQSAPAGGVPVNIMVNGAAIVHNSNGIVSNGSGSTVRVGSSTITGNSNVGALITNGGTLLSYKNNQINDNATDGTPLTQVNLN